MMISRFCASTWLERLSRLAIGSQITLAESTPHSVAVKAAAKVYADMSGFAPTMGIIGTVLGLIHVLGNLANPDELGPLIAAAFTATLWGVLTANVVWLPVANKLKRSSQVEAQNREIIMDGILAIQAGNSPRLLEQQLSAQLAPKERPVIKKKAA